MKKQIEEIQRLKDTLPKNIFFRFIQKNLEKFLPIFHHLYPFLFVDYLTNKQIINLGCRYFFDDIKEPLICPICQIKIRLYLSGWRRTCGDNICIQTVKKQTNINKYGVENPNQCKSIKEKIKQTNRDRYGVDYITQSKNFKEKTKKTYLNKYGVEYPMQCEHIQEKSKQTLIERYGVDNSMRCKEIKEKAKQTNLDRYGVENAIQSKEIQEKSKQTLIERYGVEHPAQCNEIQEKMKQTNLDRYGVENAMQSKEIQEKSKQTNLNKYGVEHPAQCKEIQEKSKQTNLDRYGVENASQCKEIQEKSKNTSIINNFSKKLHLINTLELTGLYEIVSGRNDPFEPILLKCKKCKTLFELERKNNEFLFLRLQRYNATICETCYPKNAHFSQGEKELTNFIKSLVGEDKVIENDRKILEGKELDIFIPHLNIAFEFNGMYWHSEEYKDKNYHQNKKQLCSSKGISVFYIWEDIWNNKPEIIKSYIKNVLGCVYQKINSMECAIHNVNSSQCDDFLINNHLQGNIKRSEHNLGLFFNNKLVSLMVLGIRNNQMEILRFCDCLDTNVIGGFNMLLKHFQKEYQENIVAFIDLDWGCPLKNVYKDNQFEFISITEPICFYSDGINRFDHKYIEDENLNKNKFFKIYKCGDLKFEFFKS